MAQLLRYWMQCRHPVTLKSHSGGGSGLQSIVRCSRSRTVCLCTWWSDTRGKRAARWCWSAAWRHTWVEEKKCRMLTPLPTSRANTQPVTRAEQLKCCSSSERRTSLAWSESRRPASSLRNWWWRRRGGAWWSWPVWWRWRGGTRRWGPRWSSPADKQAVRSVSMGKNQSSLHLFFWGHFLILSPGQKKKTSILRLQSGCTQWPRERTLTWP